MISYDEAVKIAKDLNAKINHCVEYEKGYMFSYEPEDGKETFGGADAPVVILKDTGRAVSMPYFVGRGSGKLIKDFDVK